MNEKNNQHTLTDGVCNLTQLHRLTAGKRMTGKHWNIHWLWKGKRKQREIGLLTNCKRTPLVCLQIVLPKALWLSFSIIHLPRTQAMLKQCCININFVWIILTSLFSRCRQYRDKQKPANRTRCPTLTFCLQWKRGLSTIPGFCLSGQPFLKELCILELKRRHGDCLDKHPSKSLDVWAT